MSAGPAQADICIPVPGLPCLPGPGGPTATTPPSITGTPKVDQVITATEPVWSDPSATTTYQWQRDGSVISGADEQAYTVQVDDIGADLTVVATGTVSLILSGTSTSDPVIGLIGAPPKPTSGPSITGTPVAGGELTAVPGTWTGTAPRFEYQWYRLDGGSPGAITGASDKTFRPHTGEAGLTVAVVVTAFEAGHEPGRSSSQVTIKRLASTIRLTTTTRRVPASRQPVVRLALQGQGGAPTGTVRIYDGSKKLTTVTIGTRAHGMLTVRLRPLSVGRHPLVAQYAGTSATAPSSSKKLVITVTK